MGFARKKEYTFEEVFASFRNIPEEIKQISKKRQEIWDKKLEEYKKTVVIPEFKTPEEYHNWLDNTPEGKQHAQALERINNELEQEISWGGARKGAGRKPESVHRVAFTRRLLPETLEILKEYAKEHDISETKALETAIMKLKQA